MIGIRFFFYRFPSLQAKQRPRIEEGKTIISMAAGIE
jgi:hypothetical protein